MRRVLLTDELVGALPLPERGLRVVWDAATTGFGVSLNYGGTRVYVVQTRTWRPSEARWLQTSARIGEHPRIGAPAARQIAAKCVELARARKDFRPALKLWLHEGEFGLRIYEGTAFTKPVDSHLTNVERQAAKRAAAAGLEYSLCDGFTKILFARQKGFCALTALPMDLAKEDGAFRRPWAPSLDRIDNDKGYVEDNVRLVCVVANYAKGEWSENVFRTLVTAAARNPFL